MLNGNFQTNVMAFLHLARCLAPAMIETGEGAILATGNTSALRGKKPFRVDQGSPAHPPGTARRLPDSGDAVRAQAIASFSTMIGAQGLTRELGDLELSKEILAVVRGRLVAQFAPAALRDE
ncbi:hypothetical protein [Pseudomonas sp. BIC9C]|uniref:hypothetical protein n=1 Tax=Pseudomonas sp. BIC9C TaxID=3078458 RepID=UPI002AD37FFE|nr:hypothetical protein [Pseudomonas sp. BIC9C]